MQRRTPSTSSKQNQKNNNTKSSNTDSFEERYLQHQSNISTSDSGNAVSSYMITSLDPSLPTPAPKVSRQEQKALPFKVKSIREIRHDSDVAAVKRLYQNNNNNGSSSPSTMSTTTTTNNQNYNTPPPVSRTITSTDDDPFHAVHRSQNTPQPRKNNNYSSLRNKSKFGNNGNNTNNPSLFGRQGFGGEVVLIGSNNNGKTKSHKTSATVERKNAENNNNDEENETSQHQDPEQQQQEQESPKQNQTRSKKQRSKNVITFLDADVEYSINENNNSDKKRTAKTSKSNNDGNDDENLDSPNEDDNEEEEDDDEEQLEFMKTEDEEVDDFAARLPGSSLQIEIIHVGTANRAMQPKDLVSFHALCRSVVKPSFIHFAQGVTFQDPKVALSVLRDLVFGNKNIAGLLNCDVPQQTDESEQNKDQSKNILFPDYPELIRPIIVQTEVNRMEIENSHQEKIRRNARRVMKQQRMAILRAADVILKNEERRRFTIESDERRDRAYVRIDQGHDRVRAVIACEKREKKQKFLQDMKNLILDEEEEREFEQEDILLEWRIIFSQREIFFREEVDYYWRTELKSLKRMEKELKKGIDALMAKQREQDEFSRKVYVRLEYFFRYLREKALMRRLTNLHTDAIVAREHAKDVVQARVESEMRRAKIAVAKKEEDRQRQLAEEQRKHNARMLFEDQCFREQEVEFANFQTQMDRMYAIRAEVIQTARYARRLIEPYVKKLARRNEVLARFARFLSAVPTIRIEKFDESDDAARTSMIQQQQAMYDRAAYAATNNANLHINILNYIVYGAAQNMNATTTTGGGGASGATSSPPPIASAVSGAAAALMASANYQPTVLASSTIAATTTTTTAQPTHNNSAGTSSSNVGIPGQQSFYVASSERAIFPFVGAQVAISLQNGFIPIYEHFAKEIPKLDSDLQDTFFTTKLQIDELDRTFATSVEKIQREQRGLPGGCGANNTANSSAGKDSNAKTKLVLPPTTSTAVRSQNQNNNNNNNSNNNNVGANNLFGMSTSMLVDSEIKRFYSALRDYISENHLSKHPLVVVAPLPSALDVLRAKLIPLDSSEIELQAFTRESPADVGAISSQRFFRRSRTADEETAVFAPPECNTNYERNGENNGMMGGPPPAEFTFEQVSEKLNTSQFPARTFFRHTTGAISIPQQEFVNDLNLDFDSKKCFSNEIYTHEVLVGGSSNSKNYFSPIVSDKASLLFSSKRTFKCNFEEVFGSSLSNNNNNNNDSLKVTPALFSKWLQQIGFGTMKMYQRSSDLSGLSPSVPMRQILSSFSLTGKFVTFKPRLVEYFDAAESLFECSGPYSSGPWSELRLLSPMSLMPMIGESKSLNQSKLLLVPNTPLAGSRPSSANTQNPAIIGLKPRPGSATPNSTSATTPNIKHHNHQHQHHHTPIPSTSNNKSGAATVAAVIPLQTQLQPISTLPISIAANVAAIDERLITSHPMMPKSLFRAFDAQISDSWAGCAAEICVRPPIVWLNAQHRMIRLETAEYQPSLFSPSLVADLTFPVIPFPIAPLFPKQHSFFSVPLVRNTDPFTLKVEVEVTDSDDDDDEVGSERNIRTSASTVLRCGIVLAGLPGSNNNLSFVLPEQQQQQPSASSTMQSANSHKREITYSGLHVGYIVSENVDILTAKHISKLQSQHQQFCSTPSRIPVYTAASATLTNPGDEKKEGTSKKNAKEENKSSSSPSKNQQNNNNSSLADLGTFNPSSVATAYVLPPSLASFNKVKMMTTTNSAMLNHRNTSSSDSCGDMKFFRNVDRQFFVDNGCDEAVFLSNAASNNHNNNVKKQQQPSSFKQSSYTNSEETSSGMNLCILQRGICGNRKNNQKSGRSTSTILEIVFKPDRSLRSSVGVAKLVADVAARIVMWTENPKFSNLILNSNNFLKPPQHVLSLFLQQQQQQQQQQQSKPATSTKLTQAQILEQHNYEATLCKYYSDIVEGNLHDFSMIPPKVMRVKIEGSVGEQPQQNQNNNSSSNANSNNSYLDSAVNSSPDHQNNHQQNAIATIQKIDREQFPSQSTWLGVLNFRRSPKPVLCFPSRNLLAMAATTTTRRGEEIDENDDENNIEVEDLDDDDKKAQFLAKTNSFLFQSSTTLFSNSFNSSNMSANNAKKSLSFSHNEKSQKNPLNQDSSSSSSSTFLNQNIVNRYLLKLNSHNSDVANKLSLRIQEQIQKLQLQESQKGTNSKISSQSYVAMMKAANSNKAGENNNILLPPPSKKMATLLTKLEEVQMYANQLSRERQETLKNIQTFIIAASSSTSTSSPNFNEQENQLEASIQSLIDQSNNNNNFAANTNNNNKDNSNAANLESLLLQHQQYLLQNLLTTLEPTVTIRIPSSITKENSPHHKEMTKTSNFFVSLFDNVAVSRSSDPTRDFVSNFDDDDDEENKNDDVDFNFVNDSETYEQQLQERRENMEQDFGFETILVPNNKKIQRQRKLREKNFGEVPAVASPETPIDANNNTMIRRPASPKMISSTPNQRNPSTFFSLDEPQSNNHDNNKNKSEKQKYFKKTPTFDTILKKWNQVHAIEAGTVRISMIDVDKNCSSTSSTTDNISSVLSSKNIHSAKNNHNNNNKINNDSVNMKMNTKSLSTYPASLLMVTSINNNDLLNEAILTSICDTTQDAKPHFTFDSTTNATSTKNINATSLPKENTPNVLQLEDYESFEIEQDFSTSNVISGRNGELMSNWKAPFEIVCETSPQNQNEDNNSVAIYTAFVTRKIILRTKTTKEVTVSVAANNATENSNQKKKRRQLHQQKLSMRRENSNAKLAAASPPSLHKKSVVVVVVDPSLNEEPQREPQHQQVQSSARSMASEESIVENNNNNSNGNDDQPFVEFSPTFSEFVDIPQQNSDNDNDNNNTEAGKDTPKSSRIKPQSTDTTTKMITTIEKTVEFIKIPIAKFIKSRTTVSIDIVDPVEQIQYLQKARKQDSSTTTVSDDEEMLNRQRSEQSTPVIVTPDLLSSLIQCVCFKTSRSPKWTPRRFAITMKLCWCNGRTNDQTKRFPTSATPPPPPHFLWSPTVTQTLSLCFAPCPFTALTSPSSSSNNNNQLRKQTQSTVMTDCNKLWLQTSPDVDPTSSEFLKLSDAFGFNFSTLPLSTASPRLSEIMMDHFYNNFFQDQFSKFTKRITNFHNQFLSSNQSQVSSAIDHHQNQNNSNNSSSFFTFPHCAGATLTFEKGNAIILEFDQTRGSCLPNVDGFQIKSASSAKDSAVSKFATKSSSLSWVEGTPFFKTARDVEDEERAKVETENKKTRKMIQKMKKAGCSQEDVASYIAQRKELMMNENELHDDKSGNDPFSNNNGTDQNAAPEPPTSQQKADAHNSDPATISAAVTFRLNQLRQRYVFSAFRNNDELSEFLNKERAEIKKEHDEAAAIAAAASRRGKKRNFSVAPMSPLLARRQSVTSLSIVSASPSFSSTSLPLFATTPTSNGGPTTEETTTTILPTNLKEIPVDPQRLRPEDSDDDRNNICDDSVANDKNGNDETKLFGGQFFTDRKFVTSLSTIISNGYRNSKPAPGSSSSSSSEITLRDLTFSSSASCPAILISCKQTLIIYFLKPSSLSKQDLSNLSTKIIAVKCLTPPLVSSSSSSKSASVIKVTSATKYLRATILDSTIVPRFWQTELDVVYCLNTTTLPERTTDMTFSQNSNNNNNATTGASSPNNNNSASPSSAAANATTTDDAASDNSANNNDKIFAPLLQLRPSLRITPPEMVLLDPSSQSQQQEGANSQTNAKNSSSSSPMKKPSKRNSNDLQDSNPYFDMTTISPPLGSGAKGPVIDDLPPPTKSLRAGRTNQFASMIFASDTSRRRYSKLSVDPTTSTSMMKFGGAEVILHWSEVDFNAVLQHVNPSVDISLNHGSHAYKFPFVIPNSSCYFLTRDGNKTKQVNDDNNENITKVNHHENPLRLRISASAMQDQQKLYESVQEQLVSQLEQQQLQSESPTAAQAKEAAHQARLARQKLIRKQQKEKAKRLQEQEEAEMVFLSSSSTHKNHSSYDDDDDNENEDDDNLSVDSAQINEQKAKPSSSPQSVLLFKNKYHQQKNNQHRLHGALGILDPSEQKELLRDAVFATQDLENNLPRQRAQDIISHPDCPAAMCRYWLETNTTCSINSLGEIVFDNDGFVLGKLVEQDDDEVVLEISPPPTKEAFLARYQELKKEYQSLKILEMNSQNETTSTRNQNNNNNNNQQKGNQSSNKSPSPLSRASSFASISSPPQQNSSPSLLPISANNNFYMYSKATLNRRDFYNHLICQRFLFVMGIWCWRPKNNHEALERDENCSSDSDIDEKIDQNDKNDENQDIKKDSSLEASPRGAKINAKSNSKNKTHQNAVGGTSSPKRNEISVEMNNNTNNESSSNNRKRIRHHDGSISVSYSCFYKNQPDLTFGRFSLNLTPPHSEETKFLKVPTAPSTIETSKQNSNNKDQQQKNKNNIKNKEMIVASPLPSNHSLLYSNSVPIFRRQSFFLGNDIFLNCNNQTSSWSDHINNKIFILPQQQVQNNNNITSPTTFLFNSNLISALSVNLEVQLTMRFQYVWVDCELIMKKKKPKDNRKVSKPPKQVESQPGYKKYSYYFAPLSVTPVVSSDSNKINSSFLPQVKFHFASREVILQEDQGNRILSLGRPTGAVFYNNTNNNSLPVAAAASASNNDTSGNQNQNHNIQQVMDTAVRIYPQTGIKAPQCRLKCFEACWRGAHVVVANNNNKDKSSSPSSTSIDGKIESLFIDSLIPFQNFNYRLVKGGKSAREVAKEIYFQEKQQTQSNNEQDEYYYSNGISNRNKNENIFHSARYSRFSNDDTDTVKIWSLSKHEESAFERMLARKRGERTEFSSALDLFDYESKLTATSQDQRMRERYDAVTSRGAYAKFDPIKSLGYLEVLIGAVDYHHYFLNQNVNKNSKKGKSTNNNAGNNNNDDDDDVVTAEETLQPNADFGASPSFVAFANEFSGGEEKNGTTTTIMTSPPPQNRRKSVAGSALLTASKTGKFGSSKKNNNKNVQDSNMSSQQQLPPPPSMKAMNIVKGCFDDNCTFEAELRWRRNLQKQRPFYFNDDFLNTDNDKVRWTSPLESLLACNSKQNMFSDQEIGILEKADGLERNENKNDEESSNRIANVQSSDNEDDANINILSCDDDDDHDGDQSDSSSAHDEEKYETRTTSDENQVAKNNLVHRQLCLMTSIYGSTDVISIMSRVVY